jgi:hypothetical protein
LPWRSKYPLLTGHTNTSINRRRKHTHNTFSFSSRNFSRCPTNIKAQCYSTFVITSFEYAFTVWSPAKKKASARSRQYNAELLVSPLMITDELDAAGSQTLQSPPGHNV